MPWTTPTLRQVRSTTRDYVSSALGGAALIPNSVLRILSDAMSGLAHLVLLYVDWAAKQFLPDKAEKEWLDRHGVIWLSNSDGTRGRRTASLAQGTILVTGTSAGGVLPEGTRFRSLDGVEYETLARVFIDPNLPTSVMIRAIDSGSEGNRDAGTLLSLVIAQSGIVPEAEVVSLVGGASEESDDELRARVLERIQEPPMGGAKHDYVAWAKQVPGVTRAWCAPLEMGIGTVTVRFMMDSLRIDGNGFPLEEDIAILRDWLNQKRPVAVKDFFVVAPIPYPVDFTIKNLDSDDASTRSAIEASAKQMINDRAEPGQTMYRSWVDQAISEALGEDRHDLEMENIEMPSPGHLAVLGTISYV